MKLEIISRINLENSKICGDKTACHWTPMSQQQNQRQNKN